MQKCGVSDSPKSHRKSVAEKALSALLGKHSSVGGKGRGLKLSFRASFGSRVPGLGGVLGTHSVPGSRSCSAQKRKVEPGSLRAGHADKPKALIRSHKQYPRLLQPLEKMRKIPLVENLFLIPGQLPAASSA